MAEEGFADRLQGMQQKWSQKYDEKGLFEPEPSDNEKFYITSAYTYPSGGMHIGHTRSYGLPDVIARFKRMRGFNVLYPMGWHVTSTPIVGALERLKDGEQQQLHVLRDVYGVPDEELEAMEEPMDFANHFIENSFKPGMNGMGLSVDWRREFTTNDDRYNRFIEWQYKRLRDKGFIDRGKHPVKYCLDDSNPVTTHDLLEGEDAEKQEYTLVRFKHGDTVLPCATLRPETVFGVTHIHIDPSAEYVTAEVDGEEHLLSREAAEKLDFQDRDVVIGGELDGEELVDETATNPVTGEEVPVLPASFVDADSGSGIVMSVPAHAPYDWISLQDLKDSPDTLQEYGVDPETVQEIEPKKIINVDAYEGFPAERAVEEHGVESQEDVEALEEATEEVYEKEFHSGTLNANCQDFAGDRVSEVKDRMVEQFENMGRFDSMHDFSEPVRCRCGGKVIVSLQDSWFIDYADKGWKDRVHDRFDSMNIIPENKLSQYRHTVDWLEEWPCIRNYGLGTELPFDDDFIVEPLSDSTVYMAFYTISHIIQDVDSEDLDPEFFDHVFNGEHEAEEVAEATGIDLKTVERARESFDYWYPLDWRTSAHELVQNHLTFMTFHHEALFSEQNQPRGIATWGLGLLEGQKMSSSKGHVELTSEALEKFGADTTRLFLFTSVEPWEDFDWRREEVENYKNKLQQFYRRSLEMHGAGDRNDKNHVDRYVLSKLQDIKQEAVEGLGEFQTRKAGLAAFFHLNNLANKYRNRVEEMNPEVATSLVETQVRLMAPYTPFVCEEIWSETGHAALVADQTYPEPEEQLRDREAEAAEEFLDSVVEDVREVSDMVEGFDTARLIVAEEDERDLFRDMKQVLENTHDFGEAMEELVEGRQGMGQTVQSRLESYIDSPGDLPDRVLSRERELEILNENSEYMSEQFDADIEVETVRESSHGKAGRSEPGKPAIVLE